MYTGRGEEVDFREIETRFARGGFRKKRIQ